MTISIHTKPLDVSYFSQHAHPKEVLIQERMKSSKCKQRQGYIYLIKDRYNTIFKVGFSRDPDKRIKEFSANITKWLPADYRSKTPIWLKVFAIKGLLGQEQVFHESVARYRMPGISRLAPAHTELYPVNSPAWEYALALNDSGLHSSDKTLGTNRL